MHGPFAAVWLCAYLAFLFALVSRTPVGAALWAPALCSLDNLFAGMSAKSTEPWLDGLTSGVTSGLLAMLGVAIAATALRAMPRRRLL